MSLKENALVVYLRKSYEELEKVTWLTKKQMVISSILVIGISAFATALISLLDFLFSRGYLYLLDKLAQ